MAIDKSTWPQGPWSDELDSLGWIDGATGYACAILRVPDMGHLCGYVEVPASHPLYGVSYDAQVTKKPARQLFDGWLLIEHDFDSVGGLFEVHGGITYSGDSYWADETGHWFGFDCAHAGDLSPGATYRLTTGGGGVYRDLEYVKAECASLAKQLKQVQG